MQVELSIEELDLIIDWFREVDDVGGAFRDDLILFERLNKELESAKELESMDFDDCAGGACKL